MAGSWRPNDGQGRSHQAPPPRGRADFTRGRTRDTDRANRSGQRGARPAASRPGGLFARMGAAWHRFRARPDAPQIIAGTLLALALVCGTLGVLMRPSTAQGTYALPHTASGGRVGTAAATSGTAGPILAATATPHATSTATTTSTPVPTATPQPPTPTVTPTP